MTDPRRITIRSTPDGLWLQMPVDESALDLAGLLRWANDTRVRNGRLPIPAVSVLAGALRFAARTADILGSVPPREQVVDATAADAGQWISTAAAAAVAGIGQRAVRQRISRHQLDAQRVGRQWLVRLADLQQEAS